MTNRAEYQFKYNIINASSFLEKIEAQKEYIIALEESYLKLIKENNINRNKKTLQWVN